jgi:hypothetical protein
VLPLAKNDLGAFFALQKTGLCGDRFQPTPFAGEFTFRANFVIKTAKNKKTLFFHVFLRFFALKIKQNRYSTPYIV